MQTGCARGIVPRGIVGCVPHGERGQPFEARGTEKKREAVARSSKVRLALEFINININILVIYFRIARGTRLDSSSLGGNGLDGNERWKFMRESKALIALMRRPAHGNEGGSGGKSQGKSPSMKPAPAILSR